MCTNVFVTLTSPPCDPSIGGNPSRSSNSFSCLEQDSGNSAPVQKSLPGYIARFTILDHRLG